MIEITGLKKKYNQKSVLNGLDLRIYPNEILGLIGPSGCGKTTLLRLVAGFEKPDGGRILIDNVRVTTPSQIVMPNKRNLSMIFQDLALWPHMTVEAHIGFVLSKKIFSKEELSEKIRKILGNVNLGGFNNRLPHQLSGGEQQRLAIARGVASNPGFLLMDEPFSNLDPILKKEQEGFILRLKNKLQMGIVYVTHNIAEVNRLARRIAVMDKGRIVQVDTRKNIFQNPKNDFVQKFLNLS
jgi:ABC-type sugar transport system ATPase subunit